MSASFNGEGAEAAPGVGQVLRPLPERWRFVAVLFAALGGALIGANLTTWPGTPLGAVTGSLLAASLVCAREWLSIRLLPPPPNHPVRTAPAPPTPADVVQRTVAERVTRPLATTRIDDEVVTVLRKLRAEPRASTREDSERRAQHLVRETSIDPVQAEYARRRSIQRRLELIPSLTIAWLLMATLQRVGAPWPLVPAAVPAGLLAATVLRYLRVRIPDKRLSPAPASGYSPFTELGCVGGNLAEATSFGGAEVFGIAGEKRTAELLETWLGGLSRVAIFHSLRFPGSDRADIDHVIMVGHRLFIIDSKAWRGGTYRQTSAQTILTPDGSARESSMPAAAAALERWGWGAVEVLTVIHATSGSVQVHGTGAGGHMLVSPVELVRVLLEARRQEGRSPWTPEDAETFAGHVEALTRMLAAGREPCSASLAPRAS